MCGRFISVSSPELLAARFGVDEVAVHGHEPDYNVTPRASVLVVRDRDGEHRRRVLSLLRWGLVPSWATDPSIGNRLVNARAETLGTSRTYRRSFERHRCIVPADGFYEWKELSGRGEGAQRLKQPYFVHRRDGEPLAFAGLWAAWKVPDGDEERHAAPDGWYRSCVIVTTRANSLLTPIHDRMPVVLPERAWSRWLDPAERDLGALSSWLVPTSDDVLEVYPVGREVNDPRNNGPELVRRVPEA